MIKKSPLCIYKIHKGLFKKCVDDRFWKTINVKYSTLKYYQIKNESE
ncbi:hypothetical protein NPD8_3864 (plasmid) [Clostridium botulinum]|uniref:Uncharacterized protein n=1 Tax=Clostridium botulinum TaxID=1491 RepID=A0A1L7JNX2_CLOBO|nr:hypothetical protein NPD8_3864 [Clostridium botulinum]